MINWRNGKGGFVGGLKYAIKGLFQFAHSLTSAVPAAPTPDCIEAFQGQIIAIEGFEGAIIPIEGFQGDLCDD